ncbi:MAG: hypothetical protein NZT92_08120 [Abditibacteriales bacterium]|nr:hypothetical protein [Abditibacteriales bacterium]MDW8365903.1 hypothetical protein [Abditibacteriales bacterium]
MVLVGWHHGERSGCEERSEAIPSAAAVPSAGDGFAPLAMTGKRRLPRPNRHNT